MPSLSWLPSLTPLGESLEILPAAYGALYALCDARYPAPPTPPHSPSPLHVSSAFIPISNSNEKEKEQDEKERTKKERLKFFDKLMRQGIFAGCSYASSYPDIVSYLIEEMGNIVARMGIRSVKHLKDILPILCTALCDPFGVSLPLHPCHPFPEKDKIHPEATLQFQLYPSNMER
jgi:hypothetical protein